MEDNFDLSGLFAGIAPVEQVASVAPVQPKKAKSKKKAKEPILKIDIGNVFKPQHLSTESLTYLELLDEFLVGCDFYIPGIQPSVFSPIAHDFEKSLDKLTVTKETKKDILDKLNDIKNVLERKIKDLSDVDQAAIKNLMSGELLPNPDVDQGAMERMSGQLPPNPDVDQGAMQKVNNWMSGQLPPTQSNEVRESRSVVSREQSVCSDTDSAISLISLQPLMKQVNCPYCFISVSDVAMLASHLDMCDNKRNKNLQPTLEHLNYQITPGNLIKCNICKVPNIRDIAGKVKHARSKKHQSLQKPIKNESGRSQFLFCALCKISVPDNHIEFTIHIKSNEHKNNNKNIFQSKSKLEKEGVVFSLAANNNVHCVQCNSRFHFTYYNLNKHREDGTHQAHLFQKSLTTENFFCQPCNVNFNFRFVHEHVQSKDHQASKKPPPQFVHCVFCEVKKDSLGELAVHHRNCTVLSSIKHGGPVPNPNTQINNQHIKYRFSGFRFKPNMFHVMTYCEQWGEVTNTSYDGNDVVVTFSRLDEKLPTRWISDNNTVNITREGPAASNGNNMEETKTTKADPQVKSGFNKQNEEPGNDIFRELRYTPMWNPDVLRHLNTAGASNPAQPVRAGQPSLSSPVNTPSGSQGASNPAQPVRAGQPSFSSPVNTPSGSQGASNPAQPVRAGQPSLSSPVNTPSGSQGASNTTQPVRAGQPSFTSPVNTPSGSQGASNPARTVRAGQPSFTSPVNTPSGSQGASNPARTVRAGQPSFSSPVNTLSGSQGANPFAQPEQQTFPSPRNSFTQKKEDKCSIQ